MSTDCIFCKIAKRQVPAVVLAENDHSFIVKDRAPVASQHVLVIAKEHSSDITKAAESESVLDLAVKYGESNMPDGFRIVVNTGDDAGQTVKHFHMHVLGGEKLKDL